MKKIVKSVSKETPTDEELRLSALQLALIEQKKLNKIIEEKNHNKDNTSK